MQVNAKCPNCGAEILIENEKEANVCPCCKEAFITEKAIQSVDSNSQTKENKTPKKRHILKSLGIGVLRFLECVGYLLYTIFLVWLFVDLTSPKKKK